MDNWRKPIYFTSDWHIGHANSIKFDERPFRDVYHMHEVLINNYNSTVPEHGVCYFLGDVGFTNTDTVSKVMSRLHGTKICIMGNHDKGMNSLYNVGFDVVLYGAKLIIANQLVTMSHCPLEGVWRENIEGMKGAAEGDMWHGEKRLSKYFSWPDMGQFHLHGHTHKAPEERILAKQFDVGVPANKYRPVNISAIESWIATYGR